MILKKNFEFRKVKKEDYSMLISSWELAFVRKLPSSVYDWLFNGKNLIYAAYLDETIAAAFCFYPVEVIFDSQKMNGLLANNGFVTPVYRGNHLFFHLSKFSLQQIHVEGYKIAYGISNDMILPSHMKAGWKKISNMCFLQKKRKSVSEACKVKWSHGVLTETELSDIEECSMRLSLLRDFSIIKTKEWINWRYQERPDVKYLYALNYHHSKLSSYAILKYFPEKKCLHFLDIDGDNFSIKEIICEAELLNIPFETLNVWSSTIHSSIFISEGYHFEPEQRSLILIQLDKKNEISIKDSINLVLGDNEVY